MTLNAISCCFYFCVSLKINHPAQPQQIQIWAGTFGQFAKSLLISQIGQVFNNFIIRYWSRLHITLFWGLKRQCSLLASISLQPHNIEEGLLHQGAKFALQSSPQCSNGIVWVVEKMPKNSEGAMKTSSSRASKRAPTWHSCMVAPKSLYGQPQDQVWIMLARKGFLSYHTAMSSGGSFRSSWWARFHGALTILWHFFTTQRKPSENCTMGILCTSSIRKW